MISGWLPFILSTALFLLGIYCVVSKRNLAKVVIGLAISAIGLNLFLAALGHNSPAHSLGTGGMNRFGVGPEGTAPIEAAGEKAGQVMAMSDPVPQAMALVCMVVGLATLALAVAICLRLYDRYRTLDVAEIKRLRG